MSANNSVDEYIEKYRRWEKELTELRHLLLHSGLEETVKWGGPVYTVEGKNVVGLGAFKSFVSLWFFQGALLSDPAGKLFNAQEGRTKALRQWRFTSYEEIRANEETIRHYVDEAIANQKQGKTIKPDRKKPLIIPRALESILAADKDLNKRFQQLSKSRQREYAEYIAEAKREETQQRRLEKIIPLIRDGIGLHDKYRK